MGLEGVSTHSVRRTALTQMSNAGIRLRIIQEVSGHRNLEELQKYLEVRPDQVLGAVSMLGHGGRVTLENRCFLKTGHQQFAPRTATL